MVMLTSNLNVQDGLVNGVMGTVKSILPNANSTLPSAIAILFDNAKIGTAAKTSQPYLDKDCSDCIFIKPSVESFTYKTMSIQRHQYSLKLLWAVTIHKVQGQTVEKAVLSLKNIFKEGMAYVALSRVTKLQGLYLLNYDANAIYTDPQIETSLCMLPNAAHLHTCFSGFHDKISGDCVKIASLNVEGFFPNLSALQNHFILKKFDVILMQETWLQNAEIQLDESYFPFHSFIHIPRCASYTGKIHPTAKLKTSARGGVAALVHQDFNFEIIDTSSIDAEILAFTIYYSSGSVNFVNVYRPPDMNVKYFNLQLQLVLQLLQTMLVLLWEILM